MRSVQLVGLAAVCMLAMGGCETSPNIAFPSARALAARGGAGPDVTILDQGRKIYTTRCTECHVARPIAHYSVAQWLHYVSIMAPRAGLKPQDRAAVEAYVIAARKSLPPG